MTKKEAERLLEKYLAGQCTAAETAYIRAAHDMLVQPGAAEIDPARLEAIKVEIAEQLRRGGIPGFTKVGRHARPKMLPSYWAAAAVLLVVACVSLYLFLSRGPSIEPGRNRATLALADGRSINLREDQAGITMGAGLAYEDGTAIGNMMADTGLYTIAVPRGGQYRVQLADGTKVWLNAASTLTYPAKFDGTLRSISIDGEAYLEVSHQPKQPFVVETNKQQVRVLGTRFNISDYTDDDKAYTTLVDGSLEVVLITNGQRQLLTPGQQTINTLSGLTVREVDPAEATAWKEGMFQFNGQRLEEIMKQLGRWYDVDVEFADVRLRGLVFEGMMDRFGDIEDALDMLSYTGNVTFKTDGRRIIVSTQKN